MPDRVRYLHHSRRRGHDMAHTGNLESEQEQQQEPEHFDDLYSLVADMRAAATPINYRKANPAQIRKAHQHAVALLIEAADEIEDFLNAAKVPDDE
jgi:hypothetical protein